MHDALMLRCCLERIADSENELRYEVRRQRKYGTEVIKVCAKGGVVSRNTEPDLQLFFEDAMLEES